MFQVRKMKLVKKRSGVSIIGTYVENSSPLFVLDELLGSLKHEKDVLLRRVVVDWAFNVRNTQSLFHWSISAQFPKREKPTLVLDHHYADCNVAYLCYSGVGSQEI